MASKTLFKSSRGATVPTTTAVNDAGGKAYSLPDKHALAQLASTGCLNSTFYVDATDQLDSVLKLAQSVEPMFVAKVAVYARENAFMKDMPALLLAQLSTTSPLLFRKVFNRVVTDGRMLRTFVQIMRSGKVGRKSLGTAPKAMIKQWFADQTDSAIFRATIGNDPSLADIVKMVHPQPSTTAREALYSYIIGKTGKESYLPQIVKDFEAYKADRTLDLPNVPFQMLTALELNTEAWAQLAQRMTWPQARMNLNTMARHGVFDVEGMAQQIANKLEDVEQIARAKVFPYQLLAAYTASEDTAPKVIKNALSTAVEIATRNVPATGKRVAIGLDTSGSMSSSVTGYRPGSTSKLRYIDVAALFTATIARRNPGTVVLPFDTSVHGAAHINWERPILENAQVLSRFGGGGTNCSLPLAKLNADRTAVDLYVVISDSESWADRSSYNRGTGTMHEWNAYKSKHPAARMVCIDISPASTSQAITGKDILLVGGFSDTVFDVVNRFIEGDTSGEHWTNLIEETVTI